MSQFSSDTIFALSSGRPPAAIAVVRVSGSRAGTALDALIGRVPEPRRATLAKVRDPQRSDVIDEAVVLWFPGPHSETGEDVAELQLHGGRAVIAAVLAALGRIDGLRPAEAGEFTRRAFANGRLDLTEVEGLADLIAAETEAQRRQAYRQLKGVLGERAEAWRRRLIEALALVEAGIDFSDEGDVPESLTGEAKAVAAELLAEIQTTLADGQRGERLRDGMVVAIAGPPNAGKSTLLNRIARRDVAIVSPYAGTTRDVIEVHLDLGGYPVTLLDTAGVRETSDPVEQEGVNRARARAAEADLVLWIVDANRENAEIASAPVGVWLVRNKIDLMNINSNKSREGLRNERNSGIWIRIHSISAAKGAGIDSLLEALANEAASHLGAEPALITRARHRQALGAAAEALDQAIRQSEDDLVAEELRLAARALARLTGRVDVEDILDVIFRDFCIGK